MANGTQTGQAKKIKPIIVDVYAKLAGGEVEFDHDWRFDGDPATKKGMIDVPPGTVGTPPATIQFHLHDSTGLKLSFVKPTSDAMWVSLEDKCPCAAGNGGQISYNHPWGPKMLQVEDANSGPECLLYYTLRFDGDPHTDPDGKQHPPYIYDPTIKNGGGTIPASDGFLTTGTIIAAVAVVALIAVWFFWFR